MKQRIKKILSMALTLSLIWGVFGGIAPVKAFADPTFGEGTTADQTVFNILVGGTCTITATYTYYEGYYTDLPVPENFADYFSINSIPAEISDGVVHQSYVFTGIAVTNGPIEIRLNLGNINPHYDTRRYYINVVNELPQDPAPIVPNNKVSETKEPEVQNPQAPPCEHNYEWQTITAATATADGEEAYMCTKCGDVKERRGLSAMGVFEVEFANKILKAGPGATVYIDCKPWNSFGWAIRDAMKKRPDVTIKASFLSEGYKGTPLKVTIPVARTDLFDNNGYLGLCRAGTALGYDQ